VDKPALNLNKAPADRIVDLLNLGFSEKDVYEDMLEHCSFALSTEPKKQAMKDQIAQINNMSVFAKGGA
jgi:hypothetical protein